MFLIYLVLFLLVIVAIKDIIWTRPRKSKEERRRERIQEYADMLKVRPPRKKN